MSCFSFYANKLITTGEGGIIVTDDDHLAERCRSLRNLCFQPQQRFLHDEIGFNFRMTNLQAALGLSQLQRADEIIARKREIKDRYDRRLSGLCNACLPVTKNWAHAICWIYGLRLTDGRDAATVMKGLRERGVDTRPYFLGMHEQPVFHRRGLFANEHYPVSETWSRNGFYIPSGLGISDAEIDVVSDVVCEVVG
jgi:perosamine synthetase